MLKKGIARLFFIIFFLCVTTPTLLVMVDNSVNISILFSSSEEGEKNLDIEVLFFMTKINSIDLVLTTTKNSLGYYYKKYPKPHLRVDSPPPDMYTS